MKHVAAVASLVLGWSIVTPALAALPSDSYDCIVEDSAFHNRHFPDEGDMSDVMSNEFSFTFLSDGRIAVIQTTPEGPAPIKIYETDFQTDRAVFATSIDGLGMK